MKLHYKGTYDLNPDSLPAAPAKKDAVPFKEPDSIEKIAWIANGIALVLLVVLAIPIVAVGWIADFIGAALKAFLD